MSRIKLKGDTSGSVTIAAPDTGSDVTLTLPASAGTIATQDYAAGAGGLVHINTTTFSAVSSVSLNDVFTSDYDDYRIVIRSLAVSASSFGLRMRASGTDNTAAQYDVYGYYGGDGAGNIRTVTNDLWLGSVSGSVVNNWTFDLFSPATVIETQGIGSSFVGSNSGSGFWQGRAIVIRNTTAYDGISIIYTQNSTWRISIYGYKNS